MGIGINEVGVACIGAAIVDLIASVDDAQLREIGLVKGTTVLVSGPESDRLRTLVSVEREIGGGSAANTAVGVAALNHRSTLIARAVGDTLGRVYADQLRGCGVSLVDDPTELDLETGRCLVLVTEDGERTMATYLGASQNYFRQGIDLDYLVRCEALYFEGYLLDSDGALEGLTAVARELRSHQVPVILSLSDSLLVERQRTAIDHLLRSGVSHVIGNEAEVGTYTGSDSSIAMAQHLRSMGVSGVITLGEHGALGFDDRDIVTVPAVPGVKVVDTTGAGDLFAAGYLVGLVEHQSLQDSLNLGTQAAAHVIAHFGARPTRSLRE